MPNQFTIRQAGKDDLVRLIELELKRQGEKRENLSITSHIPFLVDNIQTYLVAVENGQIIGFQSHATDFPVEYSTGKRTVKKQAIFLHDFYTEPEHRGKGVSTKLLQHMLSILGEKKPGSAIYISTHTAAVSRIFENAGFKEVGICRACPSGKDMTCKGKMYKKVLPRPK